MNLNEIGKLAIQIAYLSTLPSFEGFPDWKIEEDLKIVRKLMVEMPRHPELAKVEQMLINAMKVNAAKTMRFPAGNQA